MALSLSDFTPGRTGLPCSVATVLQALSEADRKVLLAVLSDPGVQHAAISRVLNAEGHKASSLQVGRHRRRECRCAS